jgi:Uma2 family endonuclease
MRAVVLDTPQEWLDERRHLGHDRWDEVWDGVLHMVPPPGATHQRFAGRLEPLLIPLAEARGFEVIRELGLYASDKNYRQPDLVVVDPKDVSARGVERTAVIAIEILSPDDESRDKLPFYASCGVREVWLLDPTTREFDLRHLDDAYATPHTTSVVLDLTFTVAAGPKLRIEWTGGAAEV